MQKNVEIIRRKEVPDLLNISSIYIDHHPINYISIEGRVNYQWFYCTAGQGEIIVNNEAYLMQEYFSYLIPPHTGYQLYVLTPDWTLDMIEFNGKICRNILREISMENGGAYHFPKLNNFHDQIVMINELNDKKSDPEYIDYSTICYETILKLAEQAVHTKRMQLSNSSAAVHPTISTIISFLEQHYNEPIPLDQLADVTGLSKKYLCSIFKAAMGRTIITELTYIRIAHARIFLKQLPSKSIVEIAKMCGFEDSSYFGKVFKKITGYTPDQFRKNQNLE